MSNHRILFELGAGGTAAVYLAVERGPAEFTKLKVIKRIRPEIAAKPGIEEMFLQEARLTARLNHPNIVQITSVGHDGQFYFIEMEYLDGQPFTSVLMASHEGDAFNLPMRIWPLIQSLEGLQYAHELHDEQDRPLNIVHRDVSPQNLFITYDGDVKLLDFGIAKVTGSAIKTGPGNVKGKLTYMAPEQANPDMREMVDHRTDIFATGVMLWESVMKQRFWQTMNKEEIIRGLAGKSFLNQRAHHSSIPESLQRVLNLALAHHPSDRYSSAQDFRIDLEACMPALGSPVDARKMGRQMSASFGAQRERRKTLIADRLRAVNAYPNDSDIEVESLARWLAVDSATNDEHGSAPSSQVASTPTAQNAESTPLSSLHEPAKALALGTASSEPHNAGDLPHTKNDINLAPVAVEKSNSKRRETGLSIAVIAFAIALGIVVGALLFGGPHR